MIVVFEDSLLLITAEEFDKVVDIIFLEVGVVIIEDAVVEVVGEE